MKKHVTCLFGHVEAHLEFGESKHTTGGVWDLQRSEKLAYSELNYRRVLGLCRAEVGSSCHTTPLAGGGVVAAMDHI